VRWQFPNRPISDSADRTSKSSRDAAHLSIHTLWPQLFDACVTGAARKGRKSNSQPIPVKVGDVLKDVKVQSMLGWGAFIDVGSGHRGLLHVDEMKWPEGAMAPSAYDCVKEDQAVEVRKQYLMLILVHALCSTVQ